MRATVLEGPRDVRVENVPDPVLPGPEGVIVTVERTAICGSDLHLYHDAPTGIGIRLGHEVIGTVAEAGPHVRSLRPGDRVLVSGVIGCGVCRPCLAGQPNVCRAGKSAAFGTVPDLPGGQAEAHGRPLRRPLRAPHPRGRRRRRGGPADRHPPHRLPGRAAGLHPPRLDGGRRGAGPRRDHGAPVRPALRAGPDPGHRHGARTAGPGRGASGPSRSTPATPPGRSRCSRPRAGGAPTR